MSRCEPRLHAALGVLAGLALSSAITAQAAEYPVFSGPTMALGRSIWLDNCETCHAYGVAGAPLASDRQAWTTRADKGVETLYRHAIEGFFGPRGTMMPAKGANESLTDEEVTAAVDYMLRLALESQPEQPAENASH